MTQQILTNGTRSMAFEIVARGDDNAIVGGQLANDQVGVPQSADPNNNVDQLRERSVG